MNIQPFYPSAVHAPRLPRQVDTHLSLYDHIDPSNVQNIFSERPDMLLYWCNSIEGAVIERGIVGAEVYAGFQHIRHLALVLSNYEAIARYANHVYVFGEPDRSFGRLGNIHIIPLEHDDELAREWFLIVNHPTYARALIAQEVSEPGLPRADRLYTGVLTTDRWMISNLSRTLLNALR